MAISAIRKYVEGLKEGEMVATRQVLHLGTRGAVDVAMHRLSRAGSLRRVTPGLYIKGSETTPLPAPEEIIKAKAAAFDRPIVSVSKRLAMRLGFPLSNESVVVVATVGRSSSFKTTDGDVIRSVGIAPRKFTLGESAVGGALRMLWSIKEKNAKPKVMLKASRDWQDSEWNEATSRIRQLCEWLTDGLKLRSHIRSGVITAPP